jgi:xanthine dehydrogenase small subunit
MREHILLHVNGRPYRISGAQAFQTLSRFLRYDERLTGTKIVCEEGDCGACTVLIGRREGNDARLVYRPVNSCIQLLFQLDCTHVVTVEGLTRGGELTPVQDAMVRCHGAQCGYCTPGFIMAMAGMFETCAKPDAHDVRAALTGNLCRCTGYESIINAALAVESQPKVEALYPSEAIIEAIAAAANEPVRIGHFAKPVDLESAIAFKAEHPKTVIVQGATDFGVWRTKRNFEPAAILSLDGIESMNELRIDDDTLIVGGRVSLTQFEAFVRDLVPAMAPIMERFGSPQIKNAGTLAGNIANASPIADTLPFLFVTNASVELTGTNGARLVPIRDFYKGYKTLDLAADELITRILIPLPESADTLRLYKISKRSHLDISTFTAAMLMRRTDGRIDSMRIAYGGVGPVVLRLARTEEFLQGRAFAEQSFEEAGEIARGEIAPISDVRGSKEYRLQLAENILRRFFHDASGGTPPAQPPRTAAFR